MDCARIKSADFTSCTAMVLEAGVKKTLQTAAKNATSKTCHTANVFWNANHAIPSISTPRTASATTKIFLRFSLSVSTPAKGPSKNAIKYVKELITPIRAVEPVALYTQIPIAIL